MTVFHSICIEDHVIEEGEDRLELKRGKEYTTSAERADGTVIVFSRYWAKVPARLFAGSQPLGRQSERTP